MEKYMIDYLRSKDIKETKIYIFPIVLGGSKSFGHWLNDDFEDNKNIFLRCKGDTNSMTGYRIEAIVNSSNNFLIPGSGLAKYLRDKLSLEYTKGCQELINQETLKRGCSYFVPILSQYRIEKGVIESISIEYYKTSRGLSINKTTGRHIYNAIYSSLKVADENNLQSLAIPQMAK